MSIGHVRTVRLETHMASGTHIGGRPHRHAGMVNGVAGTNVMRTGEVRRGSGREVVPRACRRVVTRADVRASRRSVSVASVSQVTPATDTHTVREGGLRRIGGGGVGLELPRADIDEGCFTARRGP